MHSFRGTGIAAGRGGGGGQDARQVRSGRSAFGALDAIPRTTLAMIPHGRNRSEIPGQPACSHDRTQERPPGGPDRRPRGPGCPRKPLGSPGKALCGASEKLLSGGTAFRLKFCGIRRRLAGCRRNLPLQMPGRREGAQWHSSRAFCFVAHRVHWTKVLRLFVFSPLLVR